MYQRNFIPLFVIASIAILLVIVFGALNEEDRSQEFTIASQPLQRPRTTPLIPPPPTEGISTDPLVTPGPGAR